jgi:protocatechuate 3,4-dioxygenase beta subunit
VNPGGSKPSFDHFRTFCERFGLGVIRGVLRDQGGRPQPGYQIKLGGPNISASTTSDNQGAYGFDSLPSGTHTVSVVGTDVTESVHSDGRTTVTLDLTLPSISAPQQGVIRGVLRDQAGMRQAGCQITLGGQGVSRSVTTDSDGGYRFDGLPAGTYIVRVVSADLTRPVYSDGRSLVTLDLILPSTPPPSRGVISGLLRDRAGAPQAGHQITLVGSSLSRVVATDGDGRYRFDGLPADTYSVSVVDTDLTQSIYSDGHTPITLHLTLPSPPPASLGVITGVLCDDTGAPWTDREITLTLLGANLVRSVVTDDDGTYRLDGLPAGTYTVSVVGTDLVRPVWSDGKAHITIDLTLQPTLVARVDLGIIGGVLRDQAGMPQAGRRMSLMGPSQSRFIITDSKGAYQFDGLPAGTYVLSVAGTDLSRHIWSDGQAPVTLDLTLQH